MATISYIFTTIVPEFVVNTTTANDQFQPDVAMLDNGELFVTFDSDNVGNPAFQDVLFRRFSATGSALDITDRFDRREPARTTRRMWSICLARTIGSAVNRTGGVSNTR